jgi:methylated-DNA-[protein]-cysteine S-methyltransferase
MNKKRRSSSRRILAQSEMTPFMRKVYAVVKKIPKGQVMTYAGVAKKIGSKGASRAVGTVLSKNFDPKIPCHRVIRSDGRIGSYNRGGSRAKRALLKKEGALKF